MCWIPRSEQRQTVLQPSTHSLAFSRMVRSARHHFVDRVDALARMLHPVELYGGWCGMGDLRLVWPIRNGDGVWQCQLRKDGIKHEYRASNTHPRICGHIQLHPHPPGHIQKPRHCGICGKRKLSQQFLALRRLSYIPQPSVSSSHWTVAAPHISITQLEEERKSRKILSSGWGQVACHKGQVACHCPYEPIWAQCTHKSPYGLNEPIWAR